jgi:hypothetical protein
LAPLSGHRRAAGWIKTTQSAALHLPLRPIPSGGKPAQDRLSALYSFTLSTSFANPFARANAGEGIRKRSRDRDGWYVTRQIDERSKAVVYRIVDDWVASQT